MSNTRIQSITNQSTESAIRDEAPNIQASIINEGAADISYDSMKMAIADIEHPCTFDSVKEFYGL